MAAAALAPRKLIEGHHDGRVAIWPIRTQNQLTVGIEDTNESI